MVDAVLVDGQAGVALALDEIQHLRRVPLHVDGGDVNARGEDVVGGKVGKLQRTADKLAALGVQTAGVCHVLYYVVELVFRH